jgi:hypothetical protein
MQHVLPVLLLPTTCHFTYILPSIRSRHSYYFSQTYAPPPPPAGQVPTLPKEVMRRALEELGACDLIY